MENQTTEGRSKMKKKVSTKFNKGRKKEGRENDRSKQKTKEERKKKKRNRRKEGMKKYDYVGMQD
jgi:hypothetical protein